MLKVNKQMNGRQVRTETRFRAPILCASCKLDVSNLARSDYCQFWRTQDEIRDENSYHCELSW